MAIKNQKFGVLGVYLGALSANKLIGCAKSISLDATIEELETSCRASGGAKEFEPGDIDYTASAEGGMRVATGSDASSNITYENLLDMAMNRSLVTLTFGGSEPGDPRWTASAFITKVGLAASQGQQGTFNTSFRITGDLNKSLVPTP